MEIRKKKEAKIEGGERKKRRNEAKEGGRDGGEKQRWLCEVKGISISSIVEIISTCTCTPKHPTVLMEYMQFMFTSMPPES